MLKNELDVFKEFMKEEKCFNDIFEAVKYAIIRWKNHEEIISIYTLEQNIYYAVHMANEEFAIRLGYKLVIGFIDILSISEGQEEQKEAINKFIN